MRTVSLMAKSSRPRAIRTRDGLVRRSHRTGFHRPISTNPNGVGPSTDASRSVFACMMTLVFKNRASSIDRNSGLTAWRSPAAAHVSHGRRVQRLVGPLLQLELGSFVHEAPVMRPTPESPGHAPIAVSPAPARCHTAFRVARRRADHPPAEEPILKLSDGQGPDD